MNIPVGSDGYRDGEMGLDCYLGSLLLASFMFSCFNPISQNNSSLRVVIKSGAK